MARQIISYAPGHDLRRQLIAADPAGLKTLAVSIARGQGTLEAGTFIDLDGDRALIASQVEGVLSAVVDSDFPDPPDSLSGRFVMYTGGRFLWPQVRTANPAFVFDPVSINTLKAKGITFEATFSGFGNRWVGRP
jgi:hypothetical protein